MRTQGAKSGKRNHTNYNAGTGAQAIATDIVPFTPFSSARQNRLSAGAAALSEKTYTIAIRMESQAA